MVVLSGSPMSCLVPGWLGGVCASMFALMLALADRHFVCAFAVSFVSSVSYCRSAVGKPCVVDHDLSVVIAGSVHGIV